MTYDRLQLGDEALLDVMAAAKEAGALVCVHAEMREPHHPLERLALRQARMARGVIFRGGLARGEEAPRTTA
jgi:dihydroorotase-like cyclic amidohydrolase